MKPKKISPEVQTKPITTNVDTRLERSLPLIKRGKHITEEMEEHKKWYKVAHDKDMSLRMLPGFLKHMTEDYTHDYGTIVHALTAGGIATMWSMNRTPQGGITGFQASCVMWQFIREWMHYEGPLKLVQYNDMLYPQHRARFDKVLSPKTWAWLQAEAKKHLKLKAAGQFGKPAPRVWEHWKSIAAGKVPFGYKVKED